jgi:hypothetical protein
MKKIALFGLALTLGLVSCKKENTTTTDSTFPTDNLTVDKQQNVFVMDKTGSWCQYCPNGTEQMIMEKAKHGDRVIGFATHGGSDPLANTASDLLINNFLDSAGFPTLLVMNENSGQDIANNVLAAMNLPDLPYFGVKHSTAVTDSSINVYAKVECLNTIQNENFFVQSFLLLDGIEGRDYGNGIDLNQTSSLPIVTTGSGATPTKWALDAAFVNGEPQVKSGDIYTHDEAVFGVATNTQTFWGHNLAEVNPFGTEFLAGDVLGTKYTPLLMSIKTDGLDYSQYNAKVTIATIVWRFRNDGSNLYDYVNGYISHLD